MYRTGYFGIAGDERTITQVCLVDENNKRFCGKPINPNAQFQFCSGRPVLEYVNCPKCKEKALEIQKQAIERLRGIYGVMGSSCSCQ